MMEISHLHETSDLKKREFTKFLILGILSLSLGTIAHLKLDSHNIYYLFFIHLLSHFGLGFLIIAFLTILLETNHWRKYFEKRLSDLVIDKVYLKNINKEKLISLQTDVLKVYFQNDELGGEDGFLNHYQKNIQSIIGMPYRKDVHLNLKLEYLGDNIQLTEIMDFTCIKNGSKVQEYVSYEPEEGELLSIEDVYICVHLINDHGIDIKEFNMGSLKEKSCLNENKGFKFPLEDYNQNYNRIKVKYKVKSLLDKGRFIAWRMSHPTKGLMINVHFPKNSKFAKEFFVNENISIIEELDMDLGFFSISISDWLMPDEGFVFQIS